MLKLCYTERSAEWCNSWWNVVRESQGVSGEEKGKVRNVTRSAEPKSLKKNGQRWTQQLLDKISENGGDTNSVQEKYYARYNKKDVKETLNRMYKSLCCYCEATISIVDYPHIEHRKPKKRFPNLTYEWDNLHLACTKCNENKSDQYDEDYPILDAVFDVPITKHLTYELYGNGVWRKPETPQGKTTVRHANLNRDELNVARLKVFAEAFELIRELKKDPDNPRADVTKQKLEYLCKEQYGSIIEYLRELILI